MEKATSDVKITVLRCFSTEEIFPNPPVTAKYSGPCPRFNEGQEFLIKRDTPFIMPAGFCSFAWDAIFWAIMTLRSHGDFLEWYEEPGVAIWACPDGLRPVIFKIERLEDTEKELD